jgi:GT2 family glycosyltransferase
MEVSFIVPLHNCLPLTKAMLESLRATIPPGLSHEIVLVDDASTDGTREWLGTLGGGVRVVLNERNLGYGASNNRGAAIARGECLALLNNDLVLPPGWLGPMLEVRRALGDRAGLVGNVQLDARTGAVDHAGIFINHKGKPEHIRRLPPFHRRRYAAGWPVQAMTGACVLVGRSAWVRLGGFDERYVNGCEDVDFCLRAAAEGKINAIALGSAVRHHVSRAPGRKDRDEANTYRLALRWTDTLVELGLPAWCRNHFAECLREPRDSQDPAFTWGVVFHLLGLRPPPARARGHMRGAIERELARWREMFGVTAA